MRTLFLMPDTWDLAIDSSGNIATATQTYQQAQDIASACRVFKYDMYFNQQAGIPYKEKILGYSNYSLALYRSQLEEAALSVNGVVSAIAVLSMKDRTITGAITFTNSANQTGVINL